MIAIDGEIDISVHNQGSVISEEEQKVIFDPLRRAAYRADGERKGSPGLGLGLYIARQIAEAHDASIEVESSEEAGTTFTVRLPRQGVADGDTVELSRT